MASHDTFNPYAFNPVPELDSSVSSEYHYNYGLETGSSKDGFLATPTTDEAYLSEASGDDEPVPSDKYRRNSTSSVSSYDDMDQYPMTGHWYSAPTREYHFSHSQLLKRSLVISEVHPEEGNVPLYYIEMSEFTLRKPDVTVHQLPASIGAASDLAHVPNIGKSSRTVAFAHFPKMSHQIKAGLGDPAFESSVSHIDVHNPSKLSHDRYEMLLNGKQYVWQRTSSTADGVEGDTLVRMMSRNSYQLIDVSKSEVLAVFLGNKFDAKKKGKLRVFKDIDGSNEEKLQFELLILVSISSIIEKKRRRDARRRRSAPYSGG
jgi:hypothetical protein